MSRSRPRPVSAAPDLRRQDSPDAGARSSEYPCDAQEGTDANVAASLAPARHAGQSSAMHRSNSAGERVPTRQGRADYRGGRGNRRRGTTHADTNSSRVTSTLATPSPTHRSTPGDHAYQQVQAGRGGTASARPFQTSFHQPFYQPATVLSAYPAVENGTAIRTPGIPPPAANAMARTPSRENNLAEGPAAAGYPDFTSSPTQPLVTHSDGGGIYITYGPFPPPLDLHRGGSFRPPPQAAIEPAAPYSGGLPSLYPHGQPPPRPPVYPPGRRRGWPQRSTQSPFVMQQQQVPSQNSANLSWRARGGAPPTASRPPSSLAPTLTQSLDAHARPPRADTLGEPSAESSRPQPGLATSSETPSSVDAAHQRRQVVPQQSQPRTDHVMWVGNVPSNATQEELLSIFDRAPDGNGESASHDNRNGGVISVFIISRSNCAFVNFATGELLRSAVQQFHGTHVQIGDSKMTKLVCRIRDKTEEAQSGVAGQRGKHIHVAWLKEHNRRRHSTEADAETVGPAPCSDVSNDESAADTSNEVPLSESALSSSVGSTKHAGEGGSASSSSAEVSYASTNSEMLRHPAFKRRFFILKSRNVEELDHAVQTSRWSTQSHNENVLDQAYRTSEDVMLIFSANQSGAFYGYARMSGPIQASKGQSAKSDATSHRDAHSSQAKDATLTTKKRWERPLLPEETVNLSPEPLDIPEGANVDDEDDAPAEPTLIASAKGQSAGPRPLSPSSPDVALTLDQEGSRTLPAPAATPSGPSRQTSTTLGTLNDGVLRRDMAFNGILANFVEEKRGADVSELLSPPQSMQSDVESGPSLEEGATIRNMRLDQTRGVTSGAEEDDTDAGGPSKVNTERVLAPADPLGSEFAIQWIQTRALPFSSVKNLRNPWNDNKSVRVARDGTEVAIDTGIALLDLWDRFASEGEQ